MDIPIVVTIKEIFVSILAVDILMLGGIQVVKEKYIKSGKAVEIISLVLGYIVAGLMCWSFADNLSYGLSLDQWIGVAFAFVFGGLGPAGGYKLLATFADARTPED